jgi:hypothetical protein
VARAGLVRRDCARSRARISGELPGLGEPETIASRTELYFLMMLISVVTIGFAVKVRSAWTRCLGVRNAAVAEGAVHTAIAVMAALSSLPPLCLRSCIQFKRISGVSSQHRRRRN